MSERTDRHDSLASTLAAGEEESRRVVTEAVELKGRVEVAETGLATTQTDLSATTGRVETVETDVATTQSDLTTTTGRVETVEADVATAKADLTTTTGRVETVEADVATAQADLTTTTGRVETAEEEIVRVESRLDASRLAPRVVADTTTVPNSGDVPTDNLINNLRDQVEALTDALRRSGQIT